MPEKKIVLTLSETEFFLLLEALFHHREATREETGICALLIRRLLRAMVLASR
ncbi:MAG: hypothetical protein WA708_00045 [Acidobacteriaceae bacterium]